MKKQSLIKGSLILGLAGMIAKCLGIFFRWPLILLIGNEGVGYYQLSYPLYMFYVSMASGVPVAMSKMISERNAVGDTEGSYEVVKESAYLMSVLGIGTTVVLLVFSKPIISLLKWDNKSYYALVSIALAPAIVSFVTVFRGFFQGQQNMTPSGISQILEQIGRVVVGVGAAYLLLSKGIEYSAGGAALGASAGGLMALIFLGCKYKKFKRESGIRKVKTNTELLNEILKISIPISIGATVGSIMSLIDSVLVPIKLLKTGMTSQAATDIFGQLTGKAAVLVNIPLTLSVAVCTSLIPIIAENYILKNQKEVENKINIAMRLSCVIAFPSVLGLYFLASPIMKLIFLGQYEGADILKYLAISIPFIIITQTTTSILQAVNHYIRPIINLFIGCIIKVILTWYLVPIKSINIYGAVIASITAYLCVTVLNIISLKTKLKCKIDVYSSFIKPMFSAIVMIAGVLASYLYLMDKTQNNSISCLLSIFMGIIIYMIAIVLFKVFEIDEIKGKLARKQ